MSKWTGSGSNVNINLSSFWAINVVAAVMAARKGKNIVWIYF